MIKIWIKNRSTQFLNGNLFPFFYITDYLSDYILDSCSQIQGRLSSHPIQLGNASVLLPKTIWGNKPDNLSGTKWRVMNSSEEGDSRILQKAGFTHTKNVSSIVLYICHCLIKACILLAKHNVCFLIVYMCTLHV